MAKYDGQVRIIIDTNANAAASEMDKVSKSFDSTGNSAKNVSSVFDSLSKDVQDNITQMREIALAGGKNTETFKKLAAQTKEYKDMLNQAENAVAKATGGINQQITPLNSLTSKLAGLAAGYISLRGAQMAFNAVMQSVEAYRVQERAVLSLDTTLKNAGVYTAEYSQKIQNLASEIQSYSNYGDEAIIKAQSLGQSFAGQTPITEKATKAVVDFAAATGMDLESAFTLFGKSIGSSTNALARYGVELQKGMTDSQKMEAITKQLGERYTGQAALMANSSVQLKNSIGDMSEAFGRIFNGYVHNWQSGCSKMIQATTNFINSIRIMKAETSSFSTTELEQRYNKNLEKIANYEALYEKGHHMSVLKRAADLKAENNLILDQIKYIKTRQNATTNIKPIKYTDEFSVVSPSTTVVQKTRGGRTITSQNSSRSKAVQAEKDDYEKLQASLQEARRQVELMAIAHGTNSTQVQNAFIKYRDLSTQLSNINSIFDEQKQKIEIQKGAYQELNDRIANLKTRLLDLTVEGKTDTDTFANLKLEYANSIKELENVNEQFSSNFKEKFNGISSSISSSLSSAILTPFSEGETAMQRLGNIGLSITRQIADTAIQGLLQQISLQETLNALKTGANFLSGLFGGGSSTLISSGIALAAKGNVFQNGNILPFAKGGIVKQPTIFPMANGGTGLMGEAGAEAVMPLRRMSNGRLGVEAENNNNKAVNVNIYNQSGASVETRKRDDGSMDIFIRKVNEALSSERTSSGFKAAYAREDIRGVQAV